MQPKWTLSQLSTVALNELPDDYLETYRAKVRPSRRGIACDRAEIFGLREYANRGSRDRAQIESQAALFGELEVFDAQGKRIT